MSQRLKKKLAQSEYREATIEITNPSVLQNVVGERDNNLRLIEEQLEVKVGRSNTGLTISGNASDVSLSVNLLEQLSRLLERGESLFPGDLELAIKMLSADRHLRLEDVYRDQIVINGRKHSIVPKTVNQKVYLDAIKRHDLVFGVGPAGTGKTYLAMAMAVAALTRREVKRVVLCRPAVEAGEKLGFLPGDMAEKVNPYLRPLYDALHDMVDYERAREMVEKGLIEIAPLAFMRGRTLSNAFVILDEAQNTSRGQMKMLLTRLGRNAKCVVTGDITQIDLPYGVESGLIEAVQILDEVEGIGIVHFTIEDVIRHPLVAGILRAYDKAEQNEPDRRGPKRGQSS